MIILSILFLFISCGKRSQLADAQKVVSQWVGKVIYLPSDIPCTYLGKDTLCPGRNTPFKILIYTDSVGCTSCKLQLYKWNALIEEANRLMEEKVSFHFYFHPKDEKELNFLFKRDNFRQTVYMDKEDKLNALNNLPQDDIYQCFLLDEDNQVVLIGNPARNHVLWDLYKQTILGTEPQENNPHRLTTIEIDQTQIELTNLTIHQVSTATFIIHNTGDSPLVIEDIIASCGCTIPEWERKPVLSGEKTDIQVEVTPDVSGYFRKSITVFCNTEKSPLNLVIKGLTKDE